jgi:DNA-binding response OmpR family regulator
MASARLVQYEAVLIGAERENHGDVLFLIKFLRHEPTRCSPIRVERELDLHLRLQLFDAGVDDCVRERFFASGFAMRLGVSTRLRQAASDPAVSKTDVNVLRLGDLAIDLVRRTVTRMGKPIDLRPNRLLKKLHFACLILV